MVARALSSVGRALLSQSRSHRFESCSAHIKSRGSGERAAASIVYEDLFFTIIALR